MTKGFRIDREGQRTQKNSFDLTEDHKKKTTPAVNRYNAISEINRKQ